MRHIDATVVDQTHLRVHPPLAMPVGSVVRLAIVTANIKPHTTPKPRAARASLVPRRTCAKNRQTGVLERYLRHPLKLRSFAPLTREQAHDRA
jgi:hypothetical protein